MSQSEKVTKCRIGCGRSHSILKLVFRALGSHWRKLRKKLRDVAVGESYEMSHRVRKVSFAYAHCFRDRTVTYQLGICLKVKVTERQVTRCLVTNWKVTEWKLRNVAQPVAPSLRSHSTTSSLSLILFFSSNPQRRNKVLQILRFSIRSPLLNDDTDPFKNSSRWLQGIHTHSGWI